MHECMGPCSTLSSIRRCLRIKYSAATRAFTATYRRKSTSRTRRTACSRPLRSHTFRGATPTTRPPRSPQAPGPRAHARCGFKRLCVDALGWSKRGRSARVCGTHARLCPANYLQRHTCCSTPACSADTQRAGRGDGRPSSHPAERTCRLLCSGSVAGVEKALRTSRRIARSRARLSLCLRRPSVTLPPPPVPTACQLPHPAALGALRGVPWRIRRLACLRCLWCLWSSALHTA